MNEANFAQCRCYKAVTKIRFAWTKLLQGCYKDQICMDKTEKQIKKNQKKNQTNK